MKSIKKQSHINVQIPDRNHKEHQKKVKVLRSTSNDPHVNNTSAAGL